MKNKLAIIISTIFYIGYSKFIPGTIGSLLAIPIGILILKIGGVNCLIISIFIITIYYDIILDNLWDWIYFR